jgi:membrane protease YdiL (CAAX protease family)
MVITLLYMAIRFVVYAVYPLEHWWHWWARDTLMDIPRLLAFSLSLWAGVCLWGRRSFGWHAGRPGLGLGLGGLAVALWMMEHVLHVKTFNYPQHMFLVLCLNSLIVALLEETLFRGVILHALYDWHGTAVALWGSSALFAVYHIQAQPVSSWPSIFLVGFLFAVMRCQGVGLWWMILAHAALDSLVFLGSYGPPQFVWWSSMVCALEALFVGAYYLWSRQPSEPMGVQT